MMSVRMKADLERQSSAARRSQYLTRSGGMSRVMTLRLEGGCIKMALR